MVDEPRLSSTNKNLRLGEVLREARERASYDIAYVAAQTHLSKEVIQAIEDENFDRLSKRVFIRGYIRSYAKLLGVDVQPLMDAHQKLSSDNDIPTPVSKLAKRKQSHIEPVIIWGSAVVFVLAMGLLVAWWLNQDAEKPVELALVTESPSDQSGTVNEEQEAIGQQVTQDYLEKAHEVELGQLNPENISQQQNEIPVIENTVIVDSEAVDNFASLSEDSEQPLIKIIENPEDIEAVADRINLTMICKEESWIEILDAQERTLLRGLFQAGHTRTISGQAPLAVLLGNAPGVVLEVNGKPFDSSDYVRQDKTARFKIDDLDS